VCPFRCSAEHERANGQGDAHHRHKDERGEPHEHQRHACEQARRNASTQHRRGERLAVEQLEQRGVCCEEEQLHGRRAEEDPSGSSCDRRQRHERPPSIQTSSSLGAGVVAIAQRIASPSGPPVTWLIAPSRATGTPNKDAVAHNEENDVRSSKARAGPSANPVEDTP
jgi:hypothetical protein